MLFRKFLWFMRRAGRFIFYKTYPIDLIGNVLQNKSMIKLKAWYNFFLIETSSIAEAMEELLLIGAEDLSVIEAEETFFCCRLDKGALPSSFTHISRYEEISEEINWHEQWELFCPYYQEGMCRVPLQDFCSVKEGELLLSAGAGFGDLSHPTTELMLRQLEGKVEAKVVADIGCGSGILGLFALLLGASKVFAIDIDPLALKHTQENAQINHLQITVDTALEEGCKVDTVLLNMTFEEQKQAMACLPNNFVAKTWVTSGILQEQMPTYRSFMEAKGLVCIDTFEKDSWVCCVFNQRQQEASQ